MALATTQGVQLNYGPKAVVPMSGLSEWIYARDRGGMTRDNAGTVTIPLTHITGATNRIIDIGQIGGTYAAMRVVYVAGQTAATDPVVKLFGSSSATDATKWQVLKNRSKAVVATIAEAATDCGDGTYQYTTPDPDDHVWDLMGCRYLLVGVTVTADFATMTSCGLQIKVF